MPDLDRMVGRLRCSDVLELLPDFVDGELASDVLGRVTEHLHGCDDCEKFGGEYSELVTLLRAGRHQVPLDSDVRTRLAERMVRFWTVEDA